MLTRRGVVTAGAAAPLVMIPLKAKAAAAPPTLDEILRTPTLVDCAMSPDGKTIALLRQTVEDDVRNETGEKRVAFITFRSADDLEKEETFKLGSILVEKIAWVNNDRLLLWVIQLSGIYNARRLAVATRDGATIKYLLERGSSKITYNNTDHGDVVSLLPDDSDHILISLIERDDGLRALYRVNVLTGSGERVDVADKPHTVSWGIQNGKAVIRTDLSFDGKIANVYARPEGAREWKLVTRYSVQDMGKHDFEVLAETDEPGVMLIAAFTEGDNFRTLNKYDLNTLSWTGVVSNQRWDVDGCLLDSGGKYVAATYIDDAILYDAPDRALAADLATLCNNFRDCSVRIRDISADRKRMVAALDGPRNPETWIFFDRDRAAVGLLGDARPWLPSERLAPIQTLSLKMSDGVSIRAYLTIPLASAEGPRPMVVMPHGGPEARDSLGFDTYAQALAAKGWFVLQPNFRGSGGYGKAFADAGRREWNGRLQLDIEECVQQVLASPKIDKQRIAICGASFGGYAALMGAARNPTLYKAAVSLCGVADLPQMLVRERREGVETPSYKYWVKTIGDPVADAALLKSASPVEHAAKIKAPVLLIHGGVDETVYPEQSRIMARALRGKVRCEHREIQYMGHGPSNKDDQEKVLKWIVDFLDEYLR